MPRLDSPSFQDDVAPDADRWLTRFSLDAFIHRHTLDVIAALPEPVRVDLMHDPRFAICDYDPGDADANILISVPLGVSCGASGNGGSSRSVVLKRTLRYRPPAFVRWLIAHELAHAYLRNDGRWPGEDPEHAADALAAEWGFPKPAM